MPLTKPVLINYTMKKIELCICCVILCTAAFSQKRLTPLEYDLIFIFSGYKQHGTTAGVIGNHRMLDSTNPAGARFKRVLN
jgi:hypothetical protein